MANGEKNTRTSGHRRVNAIFERTRAKVDHTTIESQEVEESALSAIGTDMLAALTNHETCFHQASTEAKKRLDEFLTAFANQQPDEVFAVKGLFTDNIGLEVLWVSVSRMDETFFHGQLANQPLIVRHVRFNEKVRVAKNDLYDWLFIRDGELIGGFTLKIPNDDSPSYEFGNLE